MADKLSLLGGAWRSNHITHTVLPFLSLSHGLLTVVSESGNVKIFSVKWRVAGVGVGGI